MALDAGRGQAAGVSSVRLRRCFCPVAEVLGGTSAPRDALMKMFILRAPRRSIHRG